MLTNNIKKGTPIKTNQLGVVVSGTMEDNKKGNTRLIKTNGSEIGSVSYTHLTLPTKRIV